MAFSQKSLEFLVENRLRNSKEWFEAHKKEYRALVLEPMIQLTTALGPTVLAIDSQLIVDPRQGRSISRVRRDNRYTHDKSLYREVMWCVFLRDKKLWEGPPAFYFEIRPDRFDFGCGYYQAGADTMAAIREMVLRDDPVYLEARKAWKEGSFQLKGESYKRSKYPAQPEEKRDWLDRKTMSFNQDCFDFQLLFSDRLADYVAEGFRRLAPIYRFFLQAEARGPVVEEQPQPTPQFVPKRPPEMW